VTREVPGGAQELPAKSMTIDGGGLFATDPRDPSGLKTLARTFQFDLKLASAHEDLRFGTRAHVRFEHRPATLATQLYRRVRQVLLSRLGV
jgi:putative peptide zinc metalloprotease protein